jgi:hypothetical protein
MAELPALNIPSRSSSQDSVNTVTNEDEYIKMAAVSPSSRGSVITEVDPSTFSDDGDYGSPPPYTENEENDVFLDYLEGIRDENFTNKSECIGKLKTSFENLDQMGNMCVSKLQNLNYTPSGDNINNEDHVNDTLEFAIRVIIIILSYLINNN